MSRRAGRSPTDGADPVRCVRRAALACQPERRPYRTRIVGRGVGGCCYGRIQRAGDLPDYPRVTMSRDDVLHEWDTVLRPAGCSYAQAVERLGLSRAAWISTCRGRGGLGTLGRCRRCRTSRGVLRGRLGDLYVS